MFQISDFRKYLILLFRNDDGQQQGGCLGAGPQDNSDTGTAPAPAPASASPPATALAPALDNVTNFAISDMTMVNDKVVAWSRTEG